MQIPINQFNKNYFFLQIHNSYLIEINNYLKKDVIIYLNKINCY